MPFLGAVSIGCHWFISSPVGCSMWNLNLAAQTPLGFVGDDILAPEPSTTT